MTASSPQTQAQPQSQTQPHDKPTDLTSKESKLVGASSAGIRAIMYQLTSFYLRTPIKLFRPTRVDYMAITRLFVNGNLLSPSTKDYKFWKDSTLGMLVQGIKRYGWRFFPDRVLPPLIANSATGMVLYTSYLVSLQNLNDQRRDVLVEPRVWDTFRAGFFAGGMQSLAAAPIDAIYARSSANELLSGENENLWKFAVKKLRDIGFSGVFAGYGLSFLKESIGFSVYFCTFETLKNQGFAFTRNRMLEYRYYKKLMFDRDFHMSKEEYMRREVKESSKFRLLKTSFVFFGGITATLSLLSLQYPITKFQNIHYSRLEAYDIFNSARAIAPNDRQARKLLFKRYYNTYLDSFDHLMFIQSKSKLSWFDWMYKGFRRHLLSSVPGMVGGLVALEVLRSNLGD